jgi:hypothetical protein
MWTPEFLRVDMSDDEAADGAEDREDIEGSGLDREAVDIPWRDPEGADGVDARAWVTSTASSQALIRADTPIRARAASGGRFWSRVLSRL